MYNNCKEKEVFSSAIFHKHCLKSGQINYHEKELVFFFALVAISKQLFKCQSKLLLNFRPSFFLSGLDLFYIESYVLNVIKHENYWNSILLEAAVVTRIWILINCQGKKSHFLLNKKILSSFSRRWPILIFCDTLG